MGSDENGLAVISSLSFLGLAPTGGA
jgi:hypothetical protein